MKNIVVMKVRPLIKSSALIVGTTWETPGPLQNKVHLPDESAESVDDMANV